MRSALSVAGLLAVTAPWLLAVPVPPGPTVLSVVGPTNGTYTAGANLDFGVNLDAVVQVETNGGVPRLILELGSTNVFASYVDGTGSNVLTFRYTVQPLDLDTNGIVVETNLDLNGSVIQDLSGNPLVTLLNNISSTAGVLVDGSAPNATNDMFVVMENTLLNGSSVLANDRDPNAETLTTVLVTPTTNGVVDLHPDGTFTYQPATNFHGADSFVYHATDGFLISPDTLVSLTVVPTNNAPQVVTPVPDQAGIYGAAFSFTFAAGTFIDPDGDTLSYAASGMPPGITFDGATRTFSGVPTNVGTFAVSVVAGDAPTNALTATNTFQFVVGKATLLAVADNVVRSYSAPNPTLTITYTGFVGADTADGLTNPPVADTTATNGSLVGMYPITLSGGSDNKYSFVLSNGTLTITKAILTARAEDKVKILGAPNPLLTIRYTGFAPGETAAVLDSAPTVSTTATTNSAAGDYPITIVGGSDSQYDLVLVNGTLTIRPSGVPRARGTFYGLFYESDLVRNEHAGSLTLTTRDGNAFSAALVIAGKRHSFTGVFDVDGRSTNGIARPNDFPIRVEMELGGGNGIDQVTGHVTDGFWVADLTTQLAPYNARTNPAPQAGDYTMVIPGVDTNPDDPYGHSFASLIVGKQGRITLRGQLCDGTRITGGMFLTADGQWPCYLPLYAGGGSVLGWLTITNHPTNDITGLLNWTKALQIKSKTYPFGFAIQTTAFGTRYVRPPRNAGRFIDLPEGVLNFTKGGLFLPLSAQVKLTIKGTFTDLDGRGVPIFVRPNSGVFSGLFVVGGQAVPFIGILVQKTNVGAGFFLGTGQVSGRIELVPPPP